MFEDEAEDSAALQIKRGHEDHHEVWKVGQKINVRLWQPTNIPATKKIKKHGKEDRQRRLVSRSRQS